MGGDTLDREVREGLTEEVTLEHMSKRWVEASQVEEQEERTASAKALRQKKLDTDLKEGNYVWSTNRVETAPTEGEVGRGQIKKSTVGVLILF